MKQSPKPIYSAFVVLTSFVSLLFFLSSSVVATENAESPYRVVWDSPSENWLGSVPLGNGELAVSAWFDGSANLKLLFARTDSYDDFGRLVKVGSVEIALLGDAFDPALIAPFRQTLDAETGTASAVFGPQGKETRVSLWVETSRPNAVVEIESELDVAPVAKLRVWRTGNAEPLAPEVGDVFWRGNGKDKIQVRADSILEDSELTRSNRVGVYHRNVKTPYFDENVAVQGLDDCPQVADPYVDRTFGLILSGTDATRLDQTTLVAKTAKSNRFEIAVHTAQTENFEEWLAQIRQIADDAAAVSIDERRAETLKYWRDFSEKSWVRFSPNRKAISELSDAERAAVAAETFDLTRAYALKRYMTACEGRGALPIKFNGGLFAVETPGKPASHDYRRWGAGYWFQNTRLPYYSMLASGDFDLMEPFFRMYCGLVPVCEYRAQKYFGFNGAYFPECIYFTGEAFPEVYLFTPWNEREDKLQASGWHKREWVGGLELAFLALRYWEHTQDDKFLQTKAIPTANSILRFFDGYYSTDPTTGKLKMSPAQALETWWDCDDSAPEIAGMRAVLGRLLALPEAKTTEADREYWRALLKRTPELPTRIDAKSGRKALAAAAQIRGSKHNYEAPELYSVFPFRLYSFEKPGAELAQEAYRLRTDPCSFGWAQDGLFCAYLGDAEGARANLIDRARNVDKAARFPAYWGPNYDWTPDGDHGSVLATAAQALAMQTDGDAIFIAPALPKNWDVDFKLRAPKKTVVQGKIVDGEVVELNVEPKEREADVKIVGR